MTINREIVKNDFNMPFRFFYSNDQQATYVLPHFHEEIEIIYLISGELTIGIDVEEYLMQPEDLAIFNTNTVHYTNNQNPQTTALVLQISPTLIKEVVHDFGRRKFSFTPAHKLSSDSQEFHIQQKLKALLTDFHSCYQQENSSLSQIKLYALLYEILYQLFLCSEKISEEEIRSHYKYHQRISALTSYIKQNYQHTIQLETLAKVVNVSPVYLSRFFKQAMGVTISDYITYTRLEHIHADLLATDLAISEIAQQHGFGNYPQFIKKFKALYGQTPLKLRKQEKQHV